MHSIEPYLERLQWVAERDVHPVFRVHTSGTICTTKSIGEVNDVGGFRALIGDICSTYLDLGKGRNRRGKFKFGDGIADDRRISHGVGHGFSDRRTARNWQHRQEKLTVSRSLGARDGCVLAVLYIKHCSSETCLKSFLSIN